MTTRAHKHARAAKAAIPDAVRKVLVHVPAVGGEVDHDGTEAGGPKAAEFGRL